MALRASPVKRWSTFLSINTKSGTRILQPESLADKPLVATSSFQWGDPKRKQTLPPLPIFGEALPLLVSREGDEPSL